MRELERMDRILNKISRLWKQYPDQRLGQLLFNYTGLGGVSDIFHYEDEDLEEDLKMMVG